MQKRDWGGAGRWRVYGLYIRCVRINYTIEKFLIRFDRTHWRGAKNLNNSSSDEGLVLLIAELKLNQSCLWAYFRMPAGQFRVGLGNSLAFNVNSYRTMIIKKSRYRWSSDACAAGHSATVLKWPPERTEELRTGLGFYLHVHSKMFVPHSPSRQTDEVMLLFVHFCFCFVRFVLGLLWWRNFRQLYLFLFHFCCVDNQ